MKREYFLFLLAITFLNTAATQSFTAQGNVWIQAGPFFTPSYYPIGYFVEGDTIIEGMTYSKVYYYDNYWDNPYDTTYYAAIRETLDADSVWALAAGLPAEDEKLIYDFSANIGDTLNSNSYGTLFVGAIDTFVLLNGETRKQLHYTYHKIRFNGDIGIMG